MSDLIPNESDIVLDEEAIREAAKRPEHVLGWHKFIVDSAEVSVVEDGDWRGTLVISMKMFPLSDPDDPSTTVRPAVYERLSLPIDNPSVPGHKAATWMYGITSSALRVLYDEDELTPGPRMEDGEWFFNGKKIKESDVSTCREKATKEVVKLAQKLFFRETEDLNRRMFYGKLEKRPDKKNPDKFYTNITSRRHLNWGLPEGEELADLSGSAKALPTEVVPIVAAKKKATRARKR